MAVRPASCGGDQRRDATGRVVELVVVVGVVGVAPVAGVLVVLDQAEVEAQLAHGAAHADLLESVDGRGRDGPRDYRSTGGRGPSNAVPTRTDVDPAATACSRSPLMPALTRRRPRVRRAHLRGEVGEAREGRRGVGAQRRDRHDAGQPQPLGVGDRLRQLGHLGRRRAAALGVVVEADLHEHVEHPVGPDGAGRQRARPAAGGRTTRPPRRTSRRCAALLVCSRPTKCQWTPASACALARASWSRLSPKRRTPSPRSSSRSLTGWNFVTATRATSSRRAAGGGAGGAQPVLHRLQPLGQLGGAVGPVHASRTRPAWRPVTPSRR